MNDEAKTKMKVYIIDTGAAYHIAAPDIASAVAVWYEGAKEWDDVDILELDGLEIQPLQRDNWPSYFNDSEGPSADCEASFPDLVERTTKACVLTCSEWP